MPSPFIPWRLHFLLNRSPDHCFHSLPWDHPYRLTALERDLVTRPIQQFQLGEFARGRGFRHRAAASPIFDDPCFLETLDLFIAEEQEHSEILGRFLDLEGIPRLKRHWLDQIFRKLRKLAGLELCAMVLVTAEVLAIPFYQALRDATGSNLLRSIARRILYDEVSHLRFQAQTIGMLRRRRSPAVQTMSRWLHSLLLAGTALVLWHQHAHLFHAAGWDFNRYWRNARREFAHLNAAILESSTSVRTVAAAHLYLD